MKQLSLSYCLNPRKTYSVEKTGRKLEEVLSWFSQAMGPTMAALYCAVGPDFLKKVIESGSHRWKPQHFQLMKKNRKSQGAK